MKNDKQLGSGAIRLRLSLSEIFYNFCIASSSYRTVFLQSLGINAGRIGIIDSISTVANIVAPPIWGAISDKIRSPRKCFVLCLLLNSVLMALIPFAAKIGAPLYIGIIVLLALSSVFGGPANSMMEQWLIRIDNSNLGISYGSVRLWGSIGYAVLGMVYAIVLEKMDISTVYYLYIFFAAPAILLALSVPETGVNKSEKRKKLRFKDMPFSKLLNFWIVIYIIYSAVGSIPGNWKNTYFIYMMNDYGYASTSFGIFMFVSACCEVPALIVSRKFIDKFGIIKSLYLCLAVMVTELALYTFGNSIVYVFIGQIIKGLAQGMMMVCQMQLIFRLAHKGLETTTQTLIGSIGSIVSIVVSAVGGFVLEAMSIRPFFGLIMILQAAAALVLFFGILFGTRVLKKQLPEGI
ncbi:MAG: MFS transporter [Clostridia bacterium]|nr:MFS transporter [Clostridia bacterium]